MFRLQEKLKTLCCLVGSQFFLLAAHAGTYVYVSSTEGGDIAGYEINYDAQVLRPIAKVGAAKMMMPMASSMDGRYLYAISRAKPYSVFSYRIDAQTGKLQSLGTSPMPDSMVNVAIDRSGRWLMGASYGGNTLSVNRILDDGLVSVTPSFFGLSGGDKPHSLATDGSNLRLYVPHLGSNQIRMYKFDPDKGIIDTARQIVVSLKDGLGPRHFVFSKDDKFLYVLTESTGDVLVFAHDPKTGRIDLLQTVGSQPSDTRLVPGKPTPPMTSAADTTSEEANSVDSADIKITPDGRYIYTSERTLGQLSRFRVDQKTGKVKLLGLTATESSPRGFAIDPDGKYLIASGENSTTLSFYSIDAETGALSLLERPSVSRGANWVQIVRTK